MRKLSFVGFLLSATLFASAQQTPVPLGPGIHPPKLVYQVDPSVPRTWFPKSKHVEVGMVVGLDGLPTRLHIVKSGGRAFDKSALEAVSQYRFTPATKDGQPIPVTLFVMVNFRDF